jgi:NAD-dependent DNA ligase
MVEDNSERTCYVSNDCKKCSQNKICHWAFRTDIEIKKLGPKPTED